MSYHVSINDDHRSLLTEFMPYETPFIFSPKGFYRRSVNSDLGDRVSSELISYRLFTIPYKYKARMSENKCRDLDLVHPSTLSAGAKILSDYSGVILDRCAISEFSLRKPTKLSPTFYEKRFSQNIEELKSDFVDGQSDGFSQQYKSYISFFSYESYHRLYKFFDSDEFIDIETSYRFQLELDISKCFYNIYTHSISWSVKDKVYAKNNTHIHGFEKKIDSFFQRMNFNETNGIVVGPEISRVFAEIILQKVDTKLKETLEEDGFLYKKDYVIKRYIDNYYIFANDKNLLSTIEDTLKTILSEFKLYINETKTEFRKRPFISNQALVLSRVRDIIDEFFDDVFVKHGNSGWRQESYSLRLARDRKISVAKLLSKYRNALYEFDADIDSVSGFLMGVFRKRIQLYKSCPASNTNELEENIAIHRFLDDICGVLLYILGTSLTSRGIDRALQTIVLMKELFQHSSCKDVLGSINRWAEVLFSKSFVSQEIISGIQKITTESVLNNELEFSCYLVVMKHLSSNSYISESALLDSWTTVFNTREKSATFPYWLAISILYYCQGNNYKKTKYKIVSSYINFVRTHGFFDRSEAAYMFLDIGTYPDFSIVTKSVVWNVCFEKMQETHPKNSEWIDKIKDKKKYITCDNPWFVNWDINIDVCSEISKRELQFGY